MANLILIVVAILGWSMWSLSNRLATQRMDPFLVLMLGIVINLVMVPFYWPMVKSFKITGPGLGWITVSSVCGCTAVLAYSYLAIRTSVSTALSFAAIYPMVAFLLAVVFLHESFSWQRAVGLTLMVIGTIVISR